MSMRPRLSCLSLEDRANPSGPELIDPYTDVTLGPPNHAADPAVTTTNDATQVAIDTAVAIATAATGDATSTDANTYNNIYKADTLDLIYVGG
jgi:hypothetical protein